MTAQLVCSTGDLAPEEAMKVEVDGANGPVEVALARDADGGWHAISDVCSHGAVSLSDGEVEGCLVECWLHGSQFDLRTGAPLQLPAMRPVPVYPVTIDGDRVLVDVDVTVTAGTH
ncbi:3-phenylpropionate/trans-cinnamate dioxygenase ferredoxin subunit [Sediminihabitans luteus]|uniref:3-phenylpropionate/trans-cinnamate dioxygenase ferredoxin subunit n=1 Tax=Sediminihabitans luteus TaxID=1138585 RepID=A0A2M9CRG1_9CELL|nr:non-heme iron oxygenase ferredoxin subunit [Sediminihabitans luteus]PJJ74418.1 3-phenylpropionate/trans-cinnamate dioxygenase ferredoxin subunit [Sediminihabitans luteus]GIJ00215.1 non-heme iron oxygenase ferredoxin subunit [Sediminihabitans luteus]